MQLARFLDDYGPALDKAILRMYPPQYDAAVRETCGFDVMRLLRRPMGGQADAIRATALSLQRQPGTLLVGEMGCGKTLVSAAAAWLAGFNRILVMCPPHLVRKWQREIAGDGTPAHPPLFPGAQAFIVDSIRDLDRLRWLPPSECIFVIISHSRAKLGYAWRAAVVERYFTMPSGEGKRRMVRAWACPTCGAPVVDDEGIPLAPDELSPPHPRRTCKAKIAWREPTEEGSVELRQRVCGAPLWTAMAKNFGMDRRPFRGCEPGEGPHRTVLADYIRQHMPGFFDLFIGDEVHELKARGSAQGLAGASLAEACGKRLVLTGTLLGGYSSTIFNILYRFSPAIRSEFRHNDESKWINCFGFIERISTKSTDDEGGVTGRNSKRRDYKTRTQEKPGVTPTILFQILGNTVFLRLADVARSLPPYRERVITVPLDREKVLSRMTDEEAGKVVQGMASQLDAYTGLADEVKAAVNKALPLGSKRLLGIYLQSLLSYPDNPVVEEVPRDPKTGEIIGHAPALDRNHVFPKELEMIRLVADARAAGRKVLLFVTHTGTRDLTPRIKSLLSAAGYSVAVLKADHGDGPGGSKAVKPENREAWVQEQVDAGVDVLVTNPKLVMTGLDLVDFPEVCWLELDYSTYVMRQASRRSWRIGQRWPVRVTYLVYEHTLQALALALVAAKMKASLMIEGELPSEGLAALEGDDPDMYLALARKLASHQNVDAGTIEALFAEARAAELEGDRAIDPSAGFDFSAAYETAMAPPSPDDGGVSTRRVLELEGGLASLTVSVDTASLSRKARVQVEAGQGLLF